MQNQRGFVGIGVLIAILIGLAVLGGGAYYVVNQQSSARATIESPEAMPSLNTQSGVQTQTGTSVKWDIGAKIDDNFNDATVTLTLPGGVFKTTHINARNDCKELDQQNMNDEWMKKVNAGAVFEKEPTVIKPGLACVSWDTFTWYGVFSENGKYYVKQLGDDASGLGKQTWKIVKEVM